MQCIVLTCGWKRVGCDKWLIRYRQGDGNDIYMKDKKTLFYHQMFSKIVDVYTSLSDVKDDSIIAISGFNMATTPEYLILELYKRYKEQGHPRKVFIISDALPAVPGRALDQIAERLYKEPNQQFLKGALMPFLGFSPWLQKLVTDNRIECYGWPIGVTAYWFREIGSGRPGLLTKIGVDTFLDPRQDSAALNELARRNALCHVSVIDIDGEDYLLYRAPKPNYAMIRASVSDEILAMLRLHERNFYLLYQFERSNHRKHKVY